MAITCGIFYLLLAHPAPSAVAPTVEILHVGIVAAPAPPAVAPAPAPAPPAPALPEPAPEVHSAPPLPPPPLSAAIDRPQPQPAVRKRPPPPRRAPPRLAAVAPATVPPPISPAESASAAPEGGESRPEALISGGKPHFPAQAEQQGIAGGTVTVRISVTAEGAVADVAVLRADPPGVFEEVTVEAIRRWRFRPRLVNGVPSASIVEQKVTFKR